MAKQYVDFSALLCYILITEAALYGHISDNGAFSDLFNIRVKQRFLLNKCSGSLLQKISVFKKDIPRFKHIAFKLCMGDGFVSGFEILGGFRKAIRRHIDHSEAESCVLRNAISNAVESTVYIGCAAARNGIGVIKLNSRLPRKRHKDVMRSSGKLLASVNKAAGGISAGRTDGGKSHTSRTKNLGHNKMSRFV